MSKLCPMIAASENDYGWPGPAICAEKQCAWWMELVTRDGEYAAGACAVAMLASIVTSDEIIVKPQIIYEE